MQKETVQLSNCGINLQKIMVALALLELENKSVGHFTYIEYIYANF
jgi:hypothetical protein